MPYNVRNAKLGTKTRYFGGKLPPSSGEKEWNEEREWGNMRKGEWEEEGNGTEEREEA